MDDAETDSTRLVGMAIYTRRAISKELLRKISELHYFSKDLS